MVIVQVVTGEENTAAASVADVITASTLFEREERTNKREPHIATGFY